MIHEHDHIKHKDLILTICFSILLHIFIFSMAFFIPVENNIRFPKRYTYYEVNLVELPRTKAIKIIKSKNKIKISRKRKIQRSNISKKQNTIIIPKKRIKIFTRKKNSERFIEKAIAKIKMRLKNRRKNYIEQAISRIEKKIAQEKHKINAQSGVIEGFTLQLYKLKIENKIKNNWIYPAVLVNPKGKNLEAIVILRVKKDGKIIKFWFKKKSNDIIFNNSVVKAIERSNPLPPFPEGYQRRYEEIEIRFNLSELINH